MTLIEQSDRLAYDTSITMVNRGSDALQELDVLDEAIEQVGYEYPPMLAGHEPWYHMNMWGLQPLESWETEWL